MGGDSTLYAGWRQPTITRSLADASLSAHNALRNDLVRWLGKARRAGLDDDSIAALFEATFRADQAEDIA